MTCYYHYDFIPPTVGFTDGREAAQQKSVRRADFQSLFLQSTRGQSQMNDVTSEPRRCTLQPSHLWKLILEICSVTITI